MARGGRSRFELLSRRGRRRGLRVPTASDGARAEGDPGRKREQYRARHEPPPPDLAPASLSSPLARMSGLVVIVHRKGRKHMTHRAASAVSDRFRIACVVLSDRTIKRLLAEGRIGIDPYDEALLQPSSVDVRADRFFRVFHNARYPFIDVKQPQEELTELVEIDEDRPFILHPGEFVLGSTLERVTLPDDLVARLEGKSSLGRLGLLIHSTAGFIDPGWDGHVTLELSNVANLPITIYFGMKIGQLSFVQLTEAAETPYGTGELGSKYQGQQGPTPSRYWQNF
jgi:dCTP deaminase